MPEQKQPKENFTKSLAFSYSTCSLHCQLFLKGFYSKTKYNVYMKQNQMILTTEAYAKTPKRIIELNQNDLVKWTIEKEKDSLIFKGFSLQIRKEGAKKQFKIQESLEFTGESVILEQLKLYLCNYIFQSRIQEEYLIQAQIGKGNYARVFSARHRKTGQKIAIKCFEQKALKNTEFGYECLLKEIKVMQTVGNHPNLIKFIGCYEGENTYYLAMNIIEGNSLYNQIKKRKGDKFKSEDVKKYMKQILEGVNHCHKFGIMHRDLKPENIMFSDKEHLEQLVIVDFGFAEFESEKNYAFKKCGTPGYVAPEVVNYQDGISPKYGLKCDLFSVGVIFHTLLYHQSVFYGKQFEEVLSKNKNCKIDFSQKQYLATPPHTLSLLKKLLEKEPGDRISAQDALNHSYFEDDQLKTLTARLKTSFIGGTNPTIKFHVEGDLSERFRIGTEEDSTPNDRKNNQKGLKRTNSSLSFQTAGNQQQQGINSFIQNSNDNMTSFIQNIRPLFHIRLPSNSLQEPQLTGKTVIYSENQSVYRGVQDINLTQQTNQQGNINSRQKFSQFAETSDFIDKITPRIQYSPKNSARNENLTIPTKNLEIIDQNQEKTSPTKFSSRLDSSPCKVYNLKEGSPQKYQNSGYLIRQQTLDIKNNDIGDFSHQLKLVYEEDENIETPKNDFTKKIIFPISSPQSVKSNNGENSEQDQSKHKSKEFKLNADFLQPFQKQSQERRRDQYILKYIQLKEAQIQNEQDNENDHSNHNQH